MVPAKEEILWADCCDICEEEFSYKVNKEDTTEIIMSFGYFSKRDGEVGTYNLCQICSEELLDYFKLKNPNIKEPVNLNNYNDNENI